MVVYLLNCVQLLQPMDRGAYQSTVNGIIVHGILQAGILEWVVIPFSRDPPEP